MEKVLVLDCGGDRARVLSLLVRFCSVYSEIKSGDISAEDIAKGGYKGIIISGGGEFGKEILLQQIPVLAVGDAAVRLSNYLGGESETGELESGRAVMQLDSTCQLLSSLPQRSECVMGHSEYITRVPTGFRITARTEKSAVAVMENSAMGLFVARFLENSFQSEAGNRILKNFLYKICGCHAEWTAAAFIRKTVRALEPTVEGHNVLCVLTGRENEEIAARLINKSKSGAVSCLFINSGLLREGESARIERTFSSICGGKMRVVDASDRFAGKLIGITDNETKNRICREEFIRIAEEAIAEMPPAAYYCDGATQTDERMKLTGTFSGVIEPLRILYPEELTAIGEALGGEKSVGFKNPAALAECIEGEAEKEKIALIKKADFIAAENLGDASLILSADGKTVFIKTGIGDLSVIKATALKIKKETGIARVAYEI